MINSFQDLTTRFAQVARKPHVVTRKSAGAVGELFEELMIGGIVGNQSGADFAAINCEAKVHYTRTNRLTTLFCFAFTLGLKPSAFAKEFHAGMARAGRTNKHGQSVSVCWKRVMITVDGVAVAGWTIDELKERIEMKMPNLAFVNATKRGQTVTFDEMFVGQHVVAERFIDSIANGDVTIEMRSGVVQFRASRDVIKTWFAKVN